jgi:hypothetical protein
MTHSVTFVGLPFIDVNYESSVMRLGIVSEFAAGYALARSKLFF